MSDDAGNNLAKQGAYRPTSGTQPSTSASQQQQLREIAGRVLRPVSAHPSTVHSTTFSAAHPARPVTGSFHAATPKAFTLPKREAIAALVRPGLAAEAPNALVPPSRIEQIVSTGGFRRPSTSGGLLQWQTSHVISLQPGALPPQQAPRTAGLAQLLPRQPSVRSIGSTGSTDSGSAGEPEQGVQLRTHSTAPRILVPDRSPVLIASSGGDRDVPGISLQPPSAAARDVTVAAAPQRFHGSQSGAAGQLLPSPGGARSAPQLAGASAHSSNIKAQGRSGLGLSLAGHLDDDDDDGDFGDGIVMLSQPAAELGTAFGTGTASTTAATGPGGSSSSSGGGGGGIRAPVFSSASIPVMPSSAAAGARKGSLLASASAIPARGGDGLGDSANWSMLGMSALHVQLARQGVQLGSPGDALGPSALLELARQAAAEEVARVSDASTIAAQSAATASGAGASYSSSSSSSSAAVSKYSALHNITSNIEPLLSGLAQGGRRAESAKRVMPGLQVDDDDGEEDDADRQGIRMSQPTLIARPVIGGSDAKPGLAGLWHGTDTYSSFVASGDIPLQLGSEFPSAGLDLRIDTARVMREASSSKAKPLVKQARAAAVPSLDARPQMNFKGDYDNSDDDDDDDDSGNGDSLADCDDAGSVGSLESGGGDGFGSVPTRERSGFTDQTTLHLGHGMAVREDGLHHGTPPFVVHGRGGGTVGSGTLSQRTAPGPSRSASGASGARQAARRRPNVRRELVQLEQLGAGASAIVYRALHLPSLMFVAVKQVRIGDPELRSAMAREVKLLYATMVALPPAARRELNATLRTPTIGPAEPFGAAEVTPSSRPLSWGSLGGSAGGPPRTTTQQLAPGVFDATISPLPSPSALHASALGAGSGSMVRHATITPAAGAHAAAGADAGVDHLVRLYDAYTVKANGAVNIVMEYCGGGSLQRLVDGGGVQDEPALARVAAHMLRGLAFLHASHRLHRDMKPDNVLLDSGGGTFKLADFGIARELEGTLAYAKTWAGTLLYMAPEKLATSDVSEGGYSYPSDVWSLGLSLFSLAAGRYPFEDSGYWQLLDVFHKNAVPYHILDAAWARAHSATSTAGDAPPARPSALLLDFLRASLAIDPAVRATAEQLLRHPFVTSHAVGGEAADVMRCQVGVPLPAAPTFAARASRLPAPAQSLALALPSTRPYRLCRDEDRAVYADRLRALVRGVLSTHWEQFVRYFRRYRHKHRRKHSYALDGSDAAATQLLTSTLSVHMAALATQSLGDAAPQRSGSAPSAAHAGAALQSGGAQSPTAPAAPSLGSLRRNRSAASGGTAEGGKFSATIGGVPSGDTAPPSFRELALAVSDVSTLAQQLGMPPRVVAAVFNDVITERCPPPSTVLGAGSAIVRGGSGGALPSTMAGAQPRIHGSPQMIGAPHRSSPSHRAVTVTVLEPLRESEGETPRGGPATAGSGRDSLASLSPWQQQQYPASRSAPASDYTDLQSAAPGGVPGSRLQSLLLQVPSSAGATPIPSLSSAGGGSSGAGTPALPDQPSGRWTAQQQGSQGRASMAAQLTPLSAAGSGSTSGSGGTTHLARLRLSDGDHVVAIPEMPSVKGGAGGPSFRKTRSARPLR